MRKKKKYDENDEPSAPFWMVTYGDMVTLLLTFFILMLSFSYMDLKKFNNATDSILRALGVLKHSTSAVKPSVVVPQKRNVDLLRQAEIQQKIESIKEFAKQEDFENDISIQATENGILIRLGDQVLFDQGEAELKPPALPVLDHIGKTIKKNAIDILIGGHTDNIPISTPLFPSNWELSAVRAVNVLRYLTEVVGVAPEIIAATGYSEHRPITNNNTIENRRKNRRVELLIMWK